MFLNSQKSSQGLSCSNLSSASYKHCKQKHQQRLLNTECLWQATVCKRSSGLATRQGSSRQDIQNMWRTTTRKRSFGLATWQGVARPDIINSWQTTACKRSSGLATRQEQHLFFKRHFETKVGAHPWGVARSQFPQAKESERWVTQGGESGCHFSAKRLHAFLMSSSVASRATCLSSGRCKEE